MKLSELMAGITPVPEYEGPVSADDYVLAIGLEGTETKPDDYLVAQEGITEHSGALSAVTNDVTYIRSGPQNVKTGTTRTINLTGDRYAGDAFQDALLAHKIKYGTGKTVIKPYVYFCMLTGKGEQGRAAIIVTSDVGGAAGSKATFACDVKAIGTPDEFDYNPATQSAAPAKAVKG